MSEVIGEYQVVRTLESGGMTETFEARSKTSAGVSKRVCIKRVSAPRNRDRAYIARFARRARSAMPLRHGSISQVLGVGAEAGDLYAVTELVLGTSLERVLVALGARGRGMHLSTALHLVLEVCRALDHAHTRQHGDPTAEPVTHGNLHPGTVMVTWEGLVKTVDWAMPRPLGDEVSLRNRAYLAPELRAGAEPSVRSDLYAVGALLMQLITGAPPGGEAADTDVELADVEPFVRDLTLALLAERPADRPESARDVVEHLSDFINRSDRRETEGGVVTLLEWLFPAAFAELGRSTTVPHDYPETLPARGGTALRALPPPSRPVVWWTAVAVAALALVGGLALALGYQRTRSDPGWVVAVTSEPAGARVLLDGEDTGVVTDGELREVDPGQPHLITFELPGHLPESTTLVPGRVEVAVTLQPAEAPSRERAVAAADREPTPEDVPGTHLRPAVRAVWQRRPDRGEIVVDLARSWLALDQVPWRWAELDPRRRTQVSASGEVQIFPTRKLRLLIFVVTTEEGVILRQGLLHRGDRIQLPRGSARIGVVIPDGDTCVNNYGTMRLHIGASSQARHVELDSRFDCLPLARSGLSRADDLGATHRYRVTYPPTPAGPPIFVMGQGRGNVFALARTSSDALLVLRPGDHGPLEFAQMAFAFTLATEAPDGPVVRLAIEGAAASADDLMVREDLR